MADNEYVGELINYVILQDPVQAIAGGDNLFSLIFNIKGNGVFWGNPNDAIANNLFKTSKKTKSPLPKLLAGITQNPDVKIPEEYRSLWDGAKYLMSEAWDNRSSILTAAQTLAPMLMVADDGLDEPEEVAVKVNYLSCLNDLANCLDALNGQNHYLDLESVKQLVTE